MHRGACIPIQAQILPDSSHFRIYPVSTDLAKTGTGRKRAIHYFILYYVMLYYAISYYVMLCYVMLYYIVLCYITLYSLTLLHLRRSSGQRRNTRPIQSFFSFQEPSPGMKNIGQFVCGPVTHVTASARVIPGNQSLTKSARATEIHHASRC